MNDDMYRRVCKLIDSSGLERFAATLKGWLAPAIRLETHPPRKSLLPIGATKLGGAPDLPADAVWPDYQGVPMAFLAQINLRETAPYDRQHILPTAGMLSFFQKSQECFEGIEYNPLDLFDPRESGAWSVLYTPAKLDMLSRHPHPDSLIEPARFPECPITLSAMWTLPDYKSLLAHTLELDDENEDRLSELSDSIRDLFDDDDETYHLHQLLGHPPLLQEDMQQECVETAGGKHFGSLWARLSEEERAELLGGALPWTHLLQIDTDDNARMTWGEVGSLSFWIHREDLAQRRFDRCLAIQQSL